MKKMPSIFVRDVGGTGKYTTTPHPDCDWVFRGEGTPTEKIDGTCVMIRDGKLFKRYDAKNGKTPPAGFEPAQDAPDPTTGHWPGWLAVGDEPESKWHREGFANSQESRNLADGTYELIGPAIGANPYGMERHKLRRHGDVRYGEFTISFDWLKSWLSDMDIEGVVFHHTDGRMAKCTKEGLGLVWRERPKRLRKAVTQ